MYKQEINSNVEVIDEYIDIPLQIGYVQRYSRTAMMTGSILIFFTIGSFSLLLLTFVVYKTGIVHKTRDPSGHLKKEQSFTGILIMFSVFILIISFFVLFGVVSFKGKVSFPEKIAYISILMILLVLFDSFFIDLLLIGKIRPGFLKIPETTNMETMKIHVKKTFTLGLVFIIPIIIISTFIVQLILG
ncbi:MAG: hypothetical protein JXB88_08955 [Spirochaetales bacterium]|nr:hypothetical protein [Spirochaetales bacterium]